MSAGKPTAPVRVVIADDSPLFRSVLRELLQAEGDIEVVGEAADGQAAVERVQSLSPDLLTLDIQMPRLGGLDAIERIMAQRPVPILVITGQPAATGNKLVFEAIARGALELLEKGGVATKDGADVRRMVRRLARVRVVRHLGQVVATTPKTGANAGTNATAAGVGTGTTTTASAAAWGRGTRDLIAVAASSGGPSAIATVLGALPATFRGCVALVQHLPLGFATSFARFLSDHTRLEVTIVSAPTPPRAGLLLLPTDDRHLVWSGGQFTASDAPAIGGHRPSATALFRSLVTGAASRSAGVILTGMGEDGVVGLRALKLAGGVTVAQDQKTSAIYGMPKAAAEAGAADHIVALDEIAGLILRLAGADAGAFSD
jgi:two-component system chemotaxis response regulator CheB